MKLLHGILFYYFILFCPLNNFGYAAALQQPSTDMFSTLQEGFNGQEVLEKFLPGDIQASGVTIVNKNKYNIEYEVQYECVKTVSQGSLGVNGAYTFVKSSFTHPTKICMKTKGESSIAGAGGFTRINNIPGCVIVTVDAGYLKGVKNIYSKECKSDSSEGKESKNNESKGAGIHTVSNDNGVWVINNNSWSVKLYISPADTQGCYVFQELRSRLLDYSVANQFIYGVGFDVVIDPTDSRVIAASIGPGSAYYFETSAQNRLRHMSLYSGFNSPSVCIAVEGKTNFGYRFYMPGSDRPVKRGKGCLITVTDKGRGEGINLNYTSTCG